MSSGRSYARYIAVIVVIVVIVLGGAYAYLTTSSLQSQVSSLKSNQTSLLNELSSLQTELSSASTELSSASATQTMQLSSISSLQSQVSSLQTQLSGANAVQLQQLNQISSLESQLSTASSQYSSLQAQVSSLQGNITQLRGIAGLQLQTKWWDQMMVSVKANSCNKTTFTNVPYAGYIEVDFLSTSVAPLTAGLSWSAYSMTYSSTSNVIAPGSMFFIILPTSQTTLSLCDGSPFTPTTVIVTLIYHY